MNYAKLNLTFTAILLISLFFVIPLYNQWLWGNVFSPNAEIRDQATRLDTKERQLEKYGSSYKIYMEAADAIKRSNTNNIIVLLPPNNYLIAQKIKNFRSVEPAEFYYFTGYKAVWTNSPGVEQANWAIVVVHNNQIVLHRIASKDELEDLITIYKPYKPTL